MADNNSVHTKDIFSVLRSCYNSLTPSEQKVADLVLDQAEEVLRMTMAEVAEQSGVSDATAVRFMRSVGFRTFIELKLSITRAFAKSPSLIHDDIEPDDPRHIVAQKVIQGCIQALKDTQEVLDTDAFMEALDLIADAEKILVVGMGTSLPLAHELHNRLFRLRIDCHLETDGYLQVMKAALLSKKDVLIAISHGGVSDTLKTAMEAKKVGSKVICFTGNQLSSLAEVSDVVLLAVARETRSETIGSRVAQHALIQAIYVALAMRSVDITNETEQIIWDAVMRRSREHS